MTSGQVFDIRRYSIHDGPGIRTTVFFKGCPLACQWCHNPEGQSYSRELMLLPNRCVACGACVEACPQGAVTEVNGRWITDRSLCNVCGICAEVCFADSRQLVGEQKTADEIMAVLELDKAFYRHQGGVTFSGGEPLSQPKLLAELLLACRQKGIHVAVDTCGYAPSDLFLSLLPHIDLVLYDLKLMDPEMHKRFTGVSNELILHNLSLLATSGTPYWVRVPVIPGVTDTPANLSEITTFLAGLPTPPKVFLLPYHNVASNKYANLGLSYKLAPLPVPTEAELARLDTFFSTAGVPVQHGG